MVVNIDRLANYNYSIPTKLTEAKEIVEKIQEKKLKTKKQI